MPWVLWMPKGSSGTFTVSRAEGWKKERDLVELHRQIELRVSWKLKFPRLALAWWMKRCSACGKLGRADWLIQALSPFVTAVAGESQVLGAAVCCHTIAMYSL
jgi:hypothetical protein